MFFFLRGKKRKRKNKSGDKDVEDDGLGNDDEDDLSDVDFFVLFKFRIEVV